MKPQSGKVSVARFHHFLGVGGGGGAGLDGGQVGGLGSHPVLIPGSIRGGIGGVGGTGLLSLMIRLP